MCLEKNCFWIQKGKNTSARRAVPIHYKTKSFFENWLKKVDTQLKKENTRLKNDNERLRRIINNNSTNSSLPPSTDKKPSKAANEYNHRTKSKKIFFKHSSFQKEFPTI